MNKKFANHIQYNWWVYILIVLAAIFLWSSVFERLGRPDANERLNISFVGTGFDHIELQANLQEGLSKESYLKEVFVDSVTVEDNLNEILFIRSQGEFDVVIIQESVIFSGLGETYFEPLDRELMKQYFGDVAFYEENGQPYGILLTGPNFTQYYHADESCYLFVAPVSKNFAGITGGNVEDDAVVQLIEYLLGGES